MTQDHAGPSASEESAGSGAAGIYAGRHGNRHGPLPDREPLPTSVNGLSELPPEYRVALDRGLEQLDCPIGLDETRLIGDHVRLLLAWNSAINLTGIREPAAIALGNVVDSLAALPILRAADIDEFVDIGSGAGFPGLPLAIAGPARRALLVDSVAKKARFLAVVVEALGLGGTVRVAPARVETLARDPAHRGGWPAVVARAVADLAELAELSLPLLARGGLLVAWKRAPFEAELAAAEPALAALGGRVVDVRQVSVQALEGHLLVVVEKVSPTPAAFPRDPAVRRRATR